MSIVPVQPDCSTGYSTASTFKITRIYRVPAGVRVGALYVYTLSPCYHWLKIDRAPRNGQGSFPHGLPERGMHMAGAGQVFAAGGEGNRGGGFVDQIARMRSND